MGWRASRSHGAATGQKADSSPTCSRKAVPQQAGRRGRRPLGWLSHGKMQTDPGRAGSTHVDPSPVLPPLTRYRWYCDETPSTSAESGATSTDQETNTVKSSTSWSPRGATPTQHPQDPRPSQPNQDDADIFNNKLRQWEDYYNYHR